MTWQKEFKSAVLKKADTPEGAVFKKFEEDYGYSECDLCGSHTNYDFDVVYELNGKTAWKTITDKQLSAWLRELLND